MQSFTALQDTRPKSKGDEVENLNEMIQKRCREDADKRAFLVKRNGIWNSVSWGKVNRQVEEVAAGLITLGIKPGDIVAILGNTRIEWTICDLGIFRAGGISVGIYQTLTTSQSIHILSDTWARGLFLEDRYQLEKQSEELPGLSYESYSRDERLRQEIQQGIDEVNRHLPVSKPSG